MSYPGGVTRSLGYDAAGRPTTDVITRSGTLGFPYPSVSTLRDFSVTARNARGQLLSATDPTFVGGAIPSATYDSTGFLVSERATQKGQQFNGGIVEFQSADTMTYDGIGNRLTSSGNWALPPLSASGYSTANAYAVTGRLAQQNNGGVLTSYTYDAAGNTRFEVTTDGGAITGERAAYYGADDRLLAVDRRSSGQGTVEEYRYDALGRRVWVRTAINCQPSTSVECGTSAVQRTMWDGSAEVAELRAPYDAGNPALEETDSGLPSQPPAYYGDINPFFGRVVYAPGLAVDEPLSVTRYAYQDRVMGLTGTSILQWPTFTLVPFYDYRSTPVWGMYANGALSNPYASGGSDCPPPAAGGKERCVLLSWPFAGNAWNKARGGGLIYSWHGSIIATKRDGSGLHYMRNRVYDPGTGRFTQEDPIGLAGGLNAYGFAGGDPRNSSDPFGLCVTASSFKKCFDVLVRTVRTVERVGKAIHDASYTVESWLQDPISAALDGGAAAAGSASPMPRPGTGPGSVPPAQRDPQRAYTPAQKRDGLAQQGGRCAECGKETSIEEARGHHIKRHADGGRTNDTNRAIVCDGCHVEIHRAPPKPDQ
jgi:RHS repeat-associated protein